MHLCCCAPGCNADSRKFNKLEKYPWMAGIKFFSFPHKTREAKSRKLWVSMTRRSNTSTVTKHTRICSRHFVDEKPTPEHPYPTLFGHNNYKKPKKKRESQTSRSAAAQDIGAAGGLSHQPSLYPLCNDGALELRIRQEHGVGAATENVPPVGHSVSATPYQQGTSPAGGSGTRSVLCIPTTSLPPVGSEVEVCSYEHLRSKCRKSCSGE